MFFKHTPSDKGSLAEDAALRYLRKCGLSLVSRNFRSKRGEIDLIMRKRNTLVFVEVRFRSSEAYGGPLCSITQKKMHALRYTALTYMQKYTYPLIQSYRFDIVGMTGDYTHIMWIPNAFSVTEC